MEQNYYPGDKDPDGPCRETALSIVKNRIAEAKTAIAGLEAIEKILQKAEPGSPLEVTLWEMLTRNPRHIY